jgi:hypothetical protein
MVGTPRKVNSGFRARYSSIGRPSCSRCNTVASCCLLRARSPFTTASCWATVTMLRVAKILSKRRCLQFLAIYHCHFFTPLPKFFVALRLPLCLDRVSHLGPIILGFPLIVEHTVHLTYSYKLSAPRNSSAHNSFVAHVSWNFRVASYDFLHSFLGASVLGTNSSSE